MPLYRSLYDRLSSQHEAIGIIISKAGEDRLNFRYEADKWSVRDNIAHLAKYQPVFTDRIKTILREDQPRFEKYNDSEDPEFENWRKKDIPELLNTIVTDRKILFELVTSLPESELIRSGIHYRYSKLDIVQWTEFFLLHESHHIFTIYKMVHDTEIKL